MESPPSTPEWENSSEEEEASPTKSPLSSERDESLAIRGTSLSDQATLDDALGFTPYVTAIAEFLLNPDTEPPLTLSIEGEWGCGKSSFMKQLDLYLRENGQRTVWFNAWRHDKAEAVWAAFALSFIKQISTPQTLTWKEYEDKNKKENKKASLRTYQVDILKANYHILKGHLRLAISRFDLKKGWLELLQVGFLFLFVVCAAIAIPLILFIYGLEGLIQLIGALKNPDRIVQAIFYVLGIAGGSSLSLAGLFTLLKKLPGMIGSPKLNLIKYLKSPDYSKQSAFIEEFHEDFGKIVDAYVGDGKVFVFIDDLDRCEHPKAADLMQAINLMIAEDPSVVFILGMDREKVAASLAVKYEQVLTYLPSETQEIDPEILAQRNLDKGLAYGYSFIEKFVQLPFQVPQPSLTDFDHLFEQLTTPKRSSTSANIPSVKKSFWTLSKIFGFKGKNQSSPSIPTLEVTPLSEPELVEGAITQQGVQTEATPVLVPTQKRLEKIRVKLGQDSLVVRDVIRMVAPLFDYNPRRTKQFVNLFRLKVYIAYLTGLFDQIEEDEGNVIQEPLTVFQLAKFTAISLKYPLLLLDLELDKSLFSTIYRYNLGNRKNLISGIKSQGEFSSQERNTLIYWLSHDKLRELLAYDASENRNQSEADQVSSEFSLANLNIQKLLQVSPQVIRQSPEGVSSPPLVVESSSTLLTPDLKVIIDQILSQMVDIPAGHFLMGSDGNEREKPIHEVYINAFKIGKFPVTQEQYQTIMGNNPSNFQDNPKNPVENVSWHDAQAFCQKLAQLSGLSYHLPTEAQWEYACRAGTQTRYYFGDDKTQLEHYAWYKNNAERITHVVGQKKPNNWGIHDMSGNVWEWCSDKWKNNYAQTSKNNSSNLGIQDDDFVVLRGGSWEYDFERCRSAYRGREKAGIRFSGIGFRVVCRFPS